jgi:hypothetical protein
MLFACVVAAFKLAAHRQINQAQSTGEPVNGLGRQADLLLMSQNGDLFENRVLRRIFGLRRDEVTGE